MGWMMNVQSHDATFTPKLTSLTDPYLALQCKQTSLTTLYLAVRGGETNDPHSSTFGP